jgi:hypothetical protein
MSAPRDLFDVVCALDDLAVWCSRDYPDQADRLWALSQELKGYLELRVVDKGRLSITCPVCHRVSYHPQDIAQQYCGACHRFHDDNVSDTTVSQT